MTIEKLNDHKYGDYVEIEMKAFAGPRFSYYADNIVSCSIIAHLDKVWR